MKIFPVLAFLLLASTCLFAAQKPAQQDGSLESAQKLINPGALAEKDGIEKLKAASATLSDEEKESLYYQNRKVGALGLLNLALPSLGSWIVGDTAGGVTGIVGAVLGGAGVIGGAALFASGATVTSSSTSYSYSVNLVNNSPSGLAGMLLIAAGVGVFALTEVITIIGAFKYANEYNNRIMSGLGMTSRHDRAYESMKSRYAMTAPAGSPDLIRFELAVFRF